MVRWRLLSLLFGRSSGDRRWYASGDVPGIADQFTRNRGGHLGLGLACGREATVALAETNLRLPSNRLDLFGQVDDALTIAAFLASGQSIRPASLYQHGACLRVTRARDPATFGPGAAGMLGRHQADIGHQLLGIVEAGQITDLGHQRRGADQPDAAQDLKIADQRRETPCIHRFAQPRLEPSNPRLRLQHPLLHLLERSC